MENSKSLRLLYLLKILYERADEKTPWSTNELINVLLKDYGISSHRATIYEDIRLLQQFGFDIYTVKSSQNKYYLASRLFDLPELKLLIDAVESSKFITAKKSRELVEKIGALASRNSADELRRHLFPEGRLKPDNEQIYYIVDAIHAAINSQKKISFQYFRYNVHKQKELRHGGRRYIFSPWVLVWNGDFYYMLGYSEKHDMINSFRVDRIVGQPEILEEAAVPAPEGFDAGDFTNTMFRMFTGDRREIDLLCENDTMDSIIDCFGIDINTELFDNRRFVAHVETVPNHLFFNWIFGFYGKVKILSPSELKQDYLRRLQAAIENV